MLQIVTAQHDLMGGVSIQAYDIKQKTASLDTTCIGRLTWTASRAILLCVSGSSYQSLAKRAVNLPDARLMIKRANTRRSPAHIPGLSQAVATKTQSKNGPCDGDRRDPSNSLEQRFSVGTKQVLGIAHRTILG